MNFGVPTHQAPPRPSAYAVVIVSDQVLTVRDGPLLALPGGGLEQGESWTAALVRECLEEAGAVVTPGRLLGRARQYLPVKPYAKDSQFYEATLDRLTGESELEVAWVPVAEALHELYEESHAWAVVRATGGDPDWTR